MDKKVICSNADDCTQRGCEHLEPHEIEAWDSGPMQNCTAEEECEECYTGNGMVKCIP